MPEAPRELRPGLWRWERRHPEWHPGEWGARVASWALRAGDVALLVDPLLASGDEEAWALVDSLCDARRMAVLVTIPYHVRSAEPVRERCGGRLEVTIHGHAAVERRLSSSQGFRAFEEGAELPGGAVAHSIGKPRRYEMPVFLPSHDAVAFGDAVVGTGEGLRMWSAQPVDERRLRFFRERFAPTLAPLVALRPRNVLVTHGPPALGDGAEQLERAVRSDPWHHPG